MGSVGVARYVLVYSNLQSRGSSQHVDTFAGHQCNAGVDSFAGHQCNAGVD